MYRKRYIKKRAVRRRRVVSKRKKIYKRKKTTYRRRYRRKSKSPIQRAIKKNNRFCMPIYRYLSQYRQRLGYDDVQFGSDDLNKYLPGDTHTFVTLNNGDTTGNNAGLGKFIHMSFTLAQCPNLKQDLGTTVRDMYQFRIDKILYKVEVVNARELMMSPNYKPPDGDGKVTQGAIVYDMYNQAFYDKNCFYFMKRMQTDHVSGSTFTNWKITGYNHPGTKKKINFFKQKPTYIEDAFWVTQHQAVEGFNHTKTGTTVTSIVSKERNIDRHMVNGGWITPGVPVEPEYQNDNIWSGILVGKGALIVPGISAKGLDGTTNNLQPKIRVSCRVFWRLRFNSQDFNALV